MDKIKYLKRKKKDFINITLAQRGLNNKCEKWTLSLIILLSHTLRVMEQTLPVKPKVSPLISCVSIHAKIVCHIILLGTPSTENLQPKNGHG